MKKTFLILSVVGGISATNAYAAQISTAITNEPTQKAGYAIAYKCPNGCYVVKSGSNNGDTGTVTISCSDGNGKDCGEPKVVVIEGYSVQAIPGATDVSVQAISQVISSATDVPVKPSSLATDVGAKRKIDLNFSSQPNRVPAGRIRSAKSANSITVGNPKKIVYKEIVFDDGTEEFEDFEM